MFTILTSQLTEEAGLLSLFYCKTGKETHAAASPWLGINALDAAVQCYTNISMLRQQTLPSCRIHGIFKDGGVKPNIIPQRSELLYYIRSVDDKINKDLCEKVINCAKAAATATGRSSSQSFTIHLYFSYAESPNTDFLRVKLITA